MEKAYWLRRKRASLKMARSAAGSKSRLIHYDLAGRYGMRARCSETQTINLADGVPPAIAASVSEPPAEGFERG
jgi:hypothetical protein